MRSILVFLLLSATVLAGCTGNGSDSEPCDEEQVLCNPEEYYGDHYCEQNNVRPRVYAPDTAGPDTAADPWVLGDSWTYALEIDGEELADTQLIYYDIQDGGAHYMVGTPTREEALQHAVFSTNPVIGRVHRTLYSPHEAGSHADMFNFPLCEGNTWSDTFFATDFAFTAHHQPVTLPDGTTDPLGFRIDGIAADGSTSTHTYSPKAKWFTMMDVERADGTTVSMELTVLGRGYQGMAYFLRGQQDDVQDFTSTGTGSETLRVIGRQGNYETLGVYFEATRSAGNGRVELHLRQESTGESLACIGESGDGLGGATECGESPLLTEVPFSEGNYHVDLDRSLVSGQSTVSGTYRVVSIQDRSCTVGGNCGA